MSLLSVEKKQLASWFNFTYMYIDDVLFHAVLSINNIEFENYLGQEYPVELKIDCEDTTDSNTSASYLDLLQLIGEDGQFSTSISIPEQ